MTLSVNIERHPGVYNLRESFRLHSLVQLTMRSLVLWFAVLIACVVAQPRLFERKWHYRHSEDGQQDIGDWRRHIEHDGERCGHHHHQHHHRRGGRLLMKLIRCAYINDTQVNVFHDMIDAIVSNKTLDEAIQNLPQDEQGAIKDNLICVGRRRHRHDIPDPERVVEFIRKVINVEKVAECVEEFGDSCELKAKEPWEWSMCVKFSCKRSKWNDESSEEDFEEEENEDEPDEEETDFNELDF